MYVSCQRKCGQFVNGIQELAAAGVNAEGDNVLAAADLRPSERERKKAAALLQQMEEIGE